MGENSGDFAFPSWVHPLAGQRVCILTYGCTYNEGDSDRLRTILARSGSILTENPDEADVVILNTCIVVEKTERKMVRLLRELGGREIWVTGCLPAARPELLHEFPAVRILSPDSIHAVPLDHGKMDYGPVVVIQIGTGCLGHCTYCITRHARGKIRSIPLNEILSQIRAAVQGGAVEIRLTGQDLSAYGCDQGKPALASLLRKIGEMPGTFYIRLGMMNPATLNPIIDEVADAMDNEHIFSFVHLPVQSGSDSVLQRMGREYRVSDYLKMVETLRNRIPGISIATDVIPGFVEESESDFNDTCTLIEQLKPDALHVTRYSYRPGSTISRFGELPDRIRKDRSRAIIRIGYSNIKNQKQALIGCSEEVIITEQIRPGTVMGRNKSYLGVVIPEDLPVGNRYLVEYTDERTHYLLGRVIPSCHKP